MTNATNNTVNRERRAFLSKAAGVAAGSAALTLGASAGSSVLAHQIEPDPILAAIEAHRAVTVQLRAAIGTHSDLEQALPRDNRQSRIDAWDEKIVATDDPRWIDSEREVHATFDAETAAACELVNVLPTTAAGLLTLLEYAIAADSDGEMWPCELQSDDGKRTRPWHHFLIANVAEVLPGLMARRA